MPQFTENLRSMRDRVCKQRPGLDSTLAVDFLNERLRQILDRKPNWSGLLKRAVLAIPQSYTTGSVTLTNGSQVVTGSGTAWPVSDVVNTTIVETIPAPQEVYVTPASMVGISVGTMLYVDSSGPTPEIVTVQDVRAGKILCSFQAPHDAGFTATVSSLAGLQFRVNSMNPAFTVWAITSATSLVLDQPWGNITSSGNAYQLILMYTTFASDVKELIVVVDPVQMLPLRLNVSQEEIALFDATRTATDSPQCIANLGSNSAGQQIYEVYPPQSTNWQLNVLYHAKWAKMVLPNDTPPPGINPNVLIMGALADAFGTPCPRPPDYKDPFMSAQMAEYYSQRFEQAVIDNMNGDESSYQQAFTWNWSQTFGGMAYGANFMQSHDLDAMIGNY